MSHGVCRGRRPGAAVQQARDCAQGECAHDSTQASHTSHAHPLHTHTHPLSLPSPPYDAAVHAPLPHSVSVNRLTRRRPLVHLHSTVTGQIDYPDGWEDNTGSQRTLTPTSSHTATAAATSVTALCLATSSHPHLTYIARRTRTNHSPTHCSSHPYRSCNQTLARRTRTALTTLTGQWMTHKSSLVGSPPNPLLTPPPSDQVQL